jgi:hypothetical protein
MWSSDRNVDDSWIKWSKPNMNLGQTKYRKPVSILIVLLPPTSITCDQ